MTHPDRTIDLMLTFARSWRRFGGGRDEDIMVLFGLSAPEYFRRLERLLQGGALDMDERTTVELLAVCRRRLWSATSHNLPPGQPK